MRFDEDENLWLAMQFQGGIAKFDTKTEKFQVWSLPPHLNGDHVQINQVGPGRHKVDGKVWLQDAGTYTILRLDVKTRRVRGVRPVSDPAPQRLRHRCRTRRTTAGICRSAPRKWAGSTRRPAPSPGSRRRRRGSGPRRGMMDAEERLWFGENRGDKIGMFDTRTQQFKEWQPPTQGWPYDVIADRNGRRGRATNTTTASCG